jgi:spermidine/putrescine transport system substrate-binding protein
MKNLKKIASILLSLTLALSLSACGKGPTSKSVLNVYNWGDYIDEGVLDLFEQKTGIKVNYETFATNEDMYTKVSKGNTNYDITFPSDYMIEKMIASDVIQKIDVNNIPNYKNIDDRFKNLSYDPTNEYSVPYMWGTVGIVYNTKMVKDPVDSWNILWNEKYSKSIFMLDSQRDSIGITLKKLGYSLNTRNVSELEAARDALKQQKPLVLAYVGDAVKDKMISGEAALSVMWSGDAMYCRQNNPDLAYAIPKEGSNYWFDGVVILKNAPHKENAEKFIDFLCSQDIALKNTEYIGYSTPNKATYELLNDEMKKDPIYSPTDAEIKRCEIFKDLGDFVKEYDKVWTEFKSE